ncbi:uncharacterized protein C8R40DRAFT_1067722 [Lentinula edodes]|uniref:uncharacterized protein n=1 Tax=Lentinula edodes TaxID=5353 RepID=UPI001E8D8566|nr:uncharacterized protein C8R40DRAFT_1067722 [Lentinula edodes]KAH7877519.1 hypothetical protein C8R40DRAFT_1067722 [Lentinula edodes]
MLFRPVYLILGMFSAVYAAPFNTATGSGLDSLASTLITRSQGSLSHTNGNAGHLQTNGHNQGLNGHSTASESTKFEVWFSGDAKPPRPSTPSDVSNEIKTDVVSGMKKKAFTMAVYDFFFSVRHCVDELVSDDDLVAGNLSQLLLMCFTMHSSLSAFSYTLTNEPQGRAG